MASNSNIDMEGASQHLRDILKLDRPSNIADAGSGDDERKISFNGEMNGLGAGLLGAGGGPGIAEKPGPVDVPQEAQIICLSGDDGSTCIPITSNNVEIVASRDSSIDSKARGSNKVKIQPVAKYDWEHKYYYGNLITVSNTFLAYAIIGASSQAMVRVLTLGSTAERTLLKGFRGAVTDLAFAHLDSPLLAAVDQAGNLLVWRLTCSSSKILDQVVVHVRQPDSAALSSSRRLIWCPYILEDQEDQEDGGQTLALLHDDRAEVWDLEVLRSSNNSWPVDAADLKDGLIIVKGHTEPISEGALSPDGTVLATASHDGYLKFWQIYNEGGQDQPRCLHDWKPHGGNPLSCLLFCDNHKKQDPDVSFWRFLITGAEQNQELKLWCTVSWTCLQTIRFSPDPFNSLVLPSLKASLDLAAECLILTDVQRKVLYVLELLQDQESGRAGFRAVSEFLLTHPVLSFALQDVRRARLRHTDELPADEESESMTTEGNQGPQESKAGIHIKLYCVHTKSLQDVQIWFQPHLGTGPAHFLPLANSQDGFGGFSDQLMDLGVEPLSSDRESAGSHDDDLQKIPSLPAPADFLSPGGGASGAMPKLMTPDAFMTPSASVPASPGSSASSLTIVTAMSSNSDTPSRLAEDLTQSPVSQQVENLNLGSRTTSSLLLSGLDGLQASAVLSLDAPAGLDAPLLPPQASPLLPPQASPTRTRSPDVISSASTALSQDIPEIASQTLQRSLVSASSSEPLPTLHNMADSMASAASALHLLSSSSPSSAASALHLLSSSPRGRGSTDHTSSLLPLELGGAVVEGAEQRLSHTPSLLENALSQENAAAAGGGAGDGNGSHAPWPAAPDITRETRNSLRDNGLGDCSREELKDRHMSSPYHRRSYQLTQNDSQDASAEQSDHDDEVASLASSSGAGPVGVRASHRLPAKDWKTSPRSSPKLKRKSKKDDGEACQNRQMEHHQVLCGEVQEEVLLLLRGQQRELAELRQELQRISSHMDLVQSSVVSHVDRALAGHQDQQQRRLERVLMESHARNQQLHEQLAHSLSSSLSTSLSSTLSTSLSSSLSTSLSSSLSTSLSSSLSSRLDKTLREEMKKSVPQTISKVLEPVTAQLSSSIAAKLTAVEGALKDNVSKVVKSKNTTDAIGRAAAEAMQGPIQAAYKDAFQSIVLPVFERGCQAMFQQINESFKSGTNEYIQQLETHLKNRKQRDQEPLIGQMQQMIDNFQNSTDALANSVTASVRTEVQHQMHMTVGNLQESIFTQVQRIVKGEVGLALKEQQAVVTSSIMQAMRSAAGTPVPSAHLDYQAQQGAILSLLQQGQLNQAFQQALSATDLSLVLYVCESVDSQQVFSQQPCPLIQPVLLSLIQQLASNLATRTELKISYLEDAVMNLDHGDPVTRDHLSNVLAQVRTKLFQFLQQDPHGPLAKRARRLMMMLQGLVNH